MADQQLHVIIRREDDAYWATVEQYPGVLATGDTLDELRESLEEGIALIVAAPGERPPELHLSPLEFVTTDASSELTYA